MSDAVQMSKAKSALLRRYLNGGYASDSTGSSVISKRVRDGWAPLSLHQQQVWLNSQKSGLPPFYNESITIYRKGPLDLCALERCLVEILRRHEAWRTSFDVVNGQPVQIIHEAPTCFPLSVIDLRPLSESEREEKAAELAAKEVRRPFDLTEFPLFRTTMVRLGDEEYRLYLSVHQIIIDGVTAYHVLLPELISLYEAFSQGKPSLLPELSIQCADFACWQRDWLQGEVFAALAYWRKQLAGAPTRLGWPTDRPRPAKQSFRGTIRRFTLPRELSHQIRRFSQAEGVTSFVTLLTGLYILLHCYTGQSDIVVGTVSPAGRKRLEVQPLMGYFLNPVPLRLDLSGNPTVRELLFRTQKVSLGALSFDDVPFERLVEELKPETDLSRNPIFQVAASLEPSMPDVDSSWNLTPMDIENGGARWDMYLVWDDRPSGMIGRVQYNPDLLEVATVDRMLEHQEALLREVVSSPQMRLSDLTINC